MCTVHENVFLTPKRIVLFKDDIPEDFPIGKALAIDTEAMGLHRGDRLCLVQLSWGDGVCYLVHVDNPVKPAPRLCALLQDQSIEKIFHFARFDVGILYRTYEVLCEPIFCTKIASRLVRTYSERHGLKELCRELLEIDISKNERTSDWGAKELTQAQKAYASADVLHLHRLREKLLQRLERENRSVLHRKACDFLPYRTVLDAWGFAEEDIFAY